MSSAARRRNVPASSALPSSLSERAPSTASPKQTASSTPRWFVLYYSALLILAVTGLAAYFLFFRAAYRSHVSFQPLEEFPAGMSRAMQQWYQTHGDSNAVRAATPATGARNDLPELLSFLSRHQRRFSAQSGVRQWEHVSSAIVEGWIAGVFESLKLDSAAAERIAAEEKGVGSIPGGSRKLVAAMDRALSPMVSLLHSESVDDSGVASNNTWSQLPQELQHWVLEGLSHCHSTTCRLLKLQLVSLWRQQVALFPEHERKDEWDLLTQLFHPDTHDHKLIDAPASVSTLASLWLRFFSSGDRAYLDRVVSLTRLTGAPAYQLEKDREIREWDAKKRARAERDRQEKYDASKAEASAAGLPAPAEPPAVKHAPPLPASPTAELHAHFFNSLLFYADDHPLVKRAFAREWALYPNDAVVQALLDTTPFNKLTKGAAA